MVFCCILNCFVAKFVFFWRFTLFCRKIGLLRFTRFCVEKILAKNSVRGEKMTNMRYASDYHWIRGSSFDEQIYWQTVDRGASWWKSILNFFEKKKMWDKMYHFTFDKMTQNSVGEMSFLGEMKQSVGDMKQIVGDMKQIWWGKWSKMCWGDAP